MPRTPAPARSETSAHRAPRFTEDSVIADVITTFPGAIETLLSYGLHCVGCSANTADSVGVGARSHGIPDATIAEMIQAVNDKAERFYASVLSAGGVMLTPAAEEAILRVAAEEKKAGIPLRVEVQGGGCAGFTYVMDFDPQRPDDVAYAFPRVTLVAAPEHAAKFGGSLIDYLDGPTGTGFKVDNPTPTGCTCGTHDGHRGDGHRAA